MRDDRLNTLIIQTPEGIAFSLLLAGPMPRFLAWLVDAACIWGLTAVAAMVLRLVAIVNADIGMALIIIANFIVTISYAIIMEWLWRGQTIGKRVLRIRVMDAEGLQLQLSQVVVRNLLRTVDSLPLFYLVGGIACLINKKWQRLGDVAANTVVVRHPELFTPSLERLRDEKYNSLRDYPHLLARMRQKISGDEASIALKALLRRDEMDPAARVELFAMLAYHFKGLVEFPAEATDGIADERYVRNVVEALYDYQRKKRISPRADNTAQGEEEKIPEV